MPFVLGDSRDVYIHIISRFEVKEWRPLDYQMCYLQNTHTQDSGEVGVEHGWLTKCSRKQNTPKYVPLRAISWLQLCTAHPYGTLLFQQVSQLGTPLLAPQTISRSLHSERPTGPKPRCRKDETSRTPTQKQYVMFFCEAEIICKRGSIHNRVIIVN